ncbi:MAG: FAD-dependent oxidoreductase [Thermoleophilia bacterium]
MTRFERPTRVLIAGGGIAALELLLALRALAGQNVAITLLAAEPLLAPRAMSVAEPFERGGAQTYSWEEIAEHQHARLVLDRLVAVDTAERVAFTHGGRRLPYDFFVAAMGARRVEPLEGALTFGMRDDAAEHLRAIVAGLVADNRGDIVFALPAPSIWPLPLYELALLTAHELREHGCDAAVRLVSAEQQPLELFGAAAADAVVPLLDALGVQRTMRAQPRDVVPGGLRIADGELIAADHVVTLADIVARPVAGLPGDRAGFIPADLHGAVPGHSGVYAAGEATSYPLRQGGLATQQADAVAAAIAAETGAGSAAAPFDPVLRGRLLTSGAPLYLQARPSGQSLASTSALWSPPEKIAGRYLAPYLATARPSRLGARPLAERVPAVPEEAAQVPGAVRLALAIARAEARCGNHTRSLQALEAARALDGDAPLPGDAAASQPDAGVPVS